MRNELIFAIIIAFASVLFVNMAVGINTMDESDAFWPTYTVYFIVSYIPYFIIKSLFAVFKLIVNGKLEWPNHKFFKYIPILILFFFIVGYIIFPLILGYDNDTDWIERLNM